MSAELTVKGLVALLFSGEFAWLVFDRDSSGDTDSGRQRYLPYVFGGLLPVCILTIWVCYLIFYDRETAARMAISFCFAVFLHICLYYLLLMPLLPLLRRHISARTCALLWMLPNYLYLTQMNYMRLPSPRWVLQPPTGLVWTLMAVWLAGFLGVLGWKIGSHLVFRARVLKNAAPVTDPSVLEVWRGEVDRGRFRKPKFKLVSSPAVQTPLSVGLFSRSVRVVLPERSYTSEELSLIFRHELIHIGREDAWNKFFLVFCTAMCWFAPLMWRAMEKSAEDLELSCDETVLLDLDDGAKRRYAELLLKTAGDERGFTTCLSASAKALRYRLRSVVEPKEKRSGALIVGVVFFLLCMSCGYVAIAYGEDTGAELIYQSRPLEEYSLYHARWAGNPYGVDDIGIDEAALHQYLSSLRMKHIGGNYSFSQEGKELTLMLDTPKGLLSVIVSDRSVKLAPLYGRANAQYYYLPDGADWDLLNACIVQAPSLYVQLTGIGEMAKTDLYASLRRVSLAEGDELLYEIDAREPPSGIYGYPASQAVLSFGLPLVGDCTVEAAPQGGGRGRAVTLSGDPMTLPLEEGPALYTIRGAFLGGDGRIYRAEFQFEVEP